MFDDLKQQLTAFEARVQAKLRELRGTLAGLRKDVGSLDAEAVGPLERVAAAVPSARGKLSQKLTAARGELVALEPPK